MTLPEPQRGLVISYGYLWHYEHRAGREEGVKNRPCVIVLAIEKLAEGTTLVRVVPVTHSSAGDPSAASTWKTSADFVPMVQLSRVLSTSDVPDGWSMHRRTGSKAEAALSLRYRDTPGPPVGDATRHHRVG
jgi:hypothetical protein